MNKKIMLLALGTVSAMMLAVPAMASALVPLHLDNAPASVVFDGVGSATLSTSGSSTQFTCRGLSGELTFDTTGPNAGTTGTAHLKLGPTCTTSVGGTCTNGGHASSITTTTLPFHLVTLTTGKPGILFTSGPGGTNHFATYTCHNVGGFLTVESVMTGSGLIGEITSPECEKEATQATISFTGAGGVQTHTKIAGTETVYTLKKGSETIALSAHSTITFSGVTKLTCT